MLFRGYYGKIALQKPHHTSEVWKGFTCPDNCTLEEAGSYEFTATATYGGVTGSATVSVEVQFDCVRCWEIVDNCIENAQERYNECVYDVLDGLKGCKEDCDIIPEGPVKWICYALCAQIAKEAAQACMGDRATRMEQCDRAKQHCIDRGCKESQ